MNTIKRITVMISFDVWEPFNVVTGVEIDDLIHKLRTKELLEHAGNVKTMLSTEVK